MKPGCEENCPLTYSARIENTDNTGTRMKDKMI